MKMKKRIAILLIAALAAGCSRQTELQSSGPSIATSHMPETSVTESSLSETKASVVEAPLPEVVMGPAENAYLNKLVGQAISEFSDSSMGEYEQAKAAFDYMIAHTVLDEPIGLELWRVHSSGDLPIPFVEQRALSPLRFGVGMCEDYAAALTLLLRGLGLEAEYVPGLTYSLEGNLVDHAWTVAKIDGIWYHLDCQLEDNISRHGTIRYRYFMRSDATMAGSHRWGQNLIASGLLTPDQNAVIEEYFQTPACPQDFPSPARSSVSQYPAPDKNAFQAQAQAEIAAYESEYGELPPMELNTVPPVFGLEGFGPPDEG